MDKYNLFSNTNVLLFEGITILIYHFALFFNILSQKKKKKKKKKKKRKKKKKKKKKNQIEKQYLLNLGASFSSYFMSERHIF